MIKKASLITMLAAGILAVAGDSTRCYSRLERSTEAFQGYFQALKSADVAVNPVERFVFSLILANTRTRQMDRAARARS